MERAQQDAVTAMRDEWQRELETLRQDVTDRRRLLAAQVRVCVCV